MRAGWVEDKGGGATIANVDDLTWDHDRLGLRVGDGFDENWTVDVAVEVDAEPLEAVGWDTVRPQSVYWEW